MHYSLKQLFNRIKNRSRSLETLYDLCNFRSMLKQFPSRPKGGDISDLHQNIAYMGQKILEDVIIYLARWMYEKTGCKNICIAGGVGLNCVANYEMMVKSKFTNIFVSPNAGDNGLSIGQALYVDNIIDGNSRQYFTPNDYLGKKYAQDEVAKAVQLYQGKHSLSKNNYWA